MNFKEWHLLQEMAYLELPQGRPLFYLDGKPVVSIDCKFERTGHVACSQILSGVRWRAQLPKTIKCPALNTTIELSLSTNENINEDVGLTKGTIGWIVYNSNLPPAEAIRITNSGNVKEVMKQQMEREIQYKTHKELSGNSPAQVAARTQEKLQNINLEELYTTIKDYWILYAELRFRPSHSQDSHPLPVKHMGNVDILDMLDLHSPEHLQQVA